MLDRIKQFIDYMNISVSSFEKKIGASDGMIRRAIKQNTDIQSKWIISISENYPDLNVNWLITGEGEMLQDDNQTSIISYEEDLKKKVQRLEQTIDILLDKIRALEEENKELKDSLDTYKKVGA